MTCRIVKLTSPNLNYFTIAGTVLMYASTYFYLLPETSEPIIVARCIVSNLGEQLWSYYSYYSPDGDLQLEHWLFTIGYSLAFGTMLSKMWRVYQIFHNPQPDRKTNVSDYYWYYYSPINVFTSLTACIFKLLVQSLSAHAALEGSACDGDHFGSDWYCCTAAFVGVSSAILERQYYTGERYRESQWWNCKKLNWLH